MYSTDNQSSDFQEILQRVRKPLFAAGADVDQDSRQAGAENERCGDSVKLYFQLDDEAKNTDDPLIRAAKHLTVGCSVCCLAADLLCETITGCRISKARNIVQQLRTWQTDPDAPAPESMNRELAALQAIRGKRSRARCFLLPLEALENLMSSL